MRKGTPQQRQNSFHLLRQARGIAGRIAQPDQETDVPGYAVTDLAKPGQIHEEPLLEQGWQRVVQVRELSKSPEVSAIVGSLEARRKKFGTMPKRFAISFSRGVFMRHFLRDRTVPLERRDLTQRTCEFDGFTPKSCDTSALSHNQYSPNRLRRQRVDCRSALTV